MKLSKNNFKFINFKYNKFNPSVNEWRNSVYTFNKYYLNTYLYEKSLNTLLTNYFNLNNVIKNTVYSLKRIIVSKADIKYTINSIVINIYVFNKEKLYYLKRILKLNNSIKKYLKNKKTIKVNTILNYKKSLLFASKIENKSQRYYLYDYYYNQYFNNNSIKYIYKGIKMNLDEKFFILYLYKRFISKLYLNNFKFNMLSLSNLSNILYNIYNKKVIFNIINLNYLHMDNSLFINAIVRKLRDRQRRVLKVLRKAITLSKIPVIDPLLLIKAKKSVKKTYEIKFENLFQGNLRKNIKKNVFEHLKNTHIIGIWLEGKGRLTRRLTASRSVFKVTYIGTRKNIFSYYQGYSSLFSKGFQKSNIDYINMNSYNRNGSFGIKSYHNTF